MVPPSRRPIGVIMGVSGTGKSTVAARLATELGWPFAEGDAFHPATNVAKMRAGIALDDDDRRPWLAAIAAWISDRERVGGGALVTCSALRRSYRDALRRDHPDIRFVCLVGDRGLLTARMTARAGHFMPASLLDSQLATFEPLGPDEPGATVDVALPLAGIVAAAARILGVDQPTDAPNS